MNVRLLAALGLLAGAVALTYALVRPSLPFPYRFVQTCDIAIADRLKDPTTYERTDVKGAKIAISRGEFFADPLRNVAPEHRAALIGSNQPARYEAIISYRAQDAVGAIIQEQATCTFVSLTGDDAPNKTLPIKVDGESNLDWIARQRPKSEEMFRRIMRNT